MSDNSKEQIQKALAKIKEARHTVEDLPPSREVSSTLTKLDCARHWLRDLLEKPSNDD